MLELSRAGLQRRARLDSTGQDESHFLSTLMETAHSGRTPAERLLDRFNGEWKHSVDPIYTENAY
jgi:glutamate--cysteine ligase